MRVLDLFCGRGGWSKPFIEDGDDVWGIDIKNYGYQGHLIQEDIRKLDGYGFYDMDLIIGSPPCVDFSTASSANKTRSDRKPESKPDPKRGLMFIEEFRRFIREAQPQFWGLENVARAEKFWMEKPLWRFKISKLGWRSLWGKAEIPYPIARFVADSVKTTIIDAKSAEKG
jgi:site-specific DNA-cytosine methylase